MSRTVRTWAPLRASFVGGGSDQPAFFEAHGGAALSAALELGVEVTVFAGPGEASVPLVAEALAMVDPGEPVCVSACSDVAWGSGLGGSSALAVAVLHALHAWRGDTPSPRQLFEEAVTLQQDRLGGAIGWQDPAAAAFGGLQWMGFGPSPEGFRSRPIVPPPDLSPRLRIVRAPRDAGPPTAHTDAGLLSALRDLVSPAAEAIERGDIDRLGAVVHEGWVTQRGRTEGPPFGSLYERCLRAGALGGVLLGAPGRGHLLLVLPKDTAPVDAVLAGLEQLPVAVSRCGSRRSG